MIPALMEETLVLLKPDCLESRNCGEVLKRFEEAGFDVFGVKMMGLSDEILREHYAHLADKPFFPEIQGFMQSSPVVALAMRGEDAITRVRDMVGPTDSTVPDDSCPKTKGKWASPSFPASACKSVPHRVA